MRTWTVETDLLVLDCVDSTNAEASRREATFTSPTWILARRQTEGKGRRNRRWLSQPGNLFATLWMQLGESPAAAAHRSFVASLSVRDACVHFAGDKARFELKWPNDVLLNGRKLAGILLECKSTGPARCSLRIGFGVNLLLAPARQSVEPEARTPACLSQIAGLTVEAEEFLTVLASCYRDREAQLRQDGFAATRTDWQQLAFGLGTQATVRLEGDVFEGIFQGIDESGQAVFCVGDLMRKVSAAEVFFRGDQNASGH